VLVVGGQVIALEARLRGGDGVIGIETSTGTRVVRGFSLDLDLLYDGEAGWMGERLPEVRRSCGFERSTTFRWSKVVGEQLSTSTFSRRRRPSCRMRDHLDALGRTPLLGPRTLMLDPPGTAADALSRR
jgi:hypothetical protein